MDNATGRPVLAPEKLNDIMSKDLDVICLGRAAVDFYGDQTGGRLEDMQSFAKYLGGSSANLAAGLARLGTKSSMLTRVGNEHMGRFVREALAREGVDVSHVATDPASPDEKTTAAEFGGALLPAGLLVLFATWSGTFAGGAKAWPTLMGWLALLLVAWFGLERWRDPLRLGPLGPIPWAGWLVLALSLAGSPVPRAGSTALLLFPILLLVPAGVARLWRHPGLATIGVRAISAVLILVALWSIIDRFRWGAERAAMPLGHHNLLALWLVVTLPLSVLPLFEGSARTRWRMLGAFGLLLGAGALVLTRSLGGAIGMSAEVAALIVLLLVGVVRVSRLTRRVALAVAGLLVALLAVFQAPRALSILAGGDSSALARLSYWRGGIAGWQERPWFGWGPGASSWLAGEHVQPVRGASLAHQVVTDLHSTPIELLFEVGLLGAAAAAALLAGFVACRVRERWQGDAVNRSLSLAGLIALIGFLAGLTVSGLFDVTALGVAGAVLMGVLLAGPSGSWSRSPTLAPLLGLLLMAALLVC